MLSESEIKAIEDRANAAILGPWIVADFTSEKAMFNEIVIKDEPGYVIAEMCVSTDQTCFFLAHSREDVPKLTEEVRRQQKVIADLKEKRRQAMTDRQEEVQEIRKLFGQMTQGPWSWGEDKLGPVLHAGSWSILKLRKQHFGLGTEGEVIARLPDYLKTLLDEIDGLTGEVKGLSSKLAELPKELSEALFGYREESEDLFMARIRELVETEKKYRVLKNPKMAKALKDFFEVYEEVLETDLEDE